MASQVKQLLDAEISKEIEGIEAAKNSNEIYEEI